MVSTIVLIGLEQREDPLQHLAFLHCQDEEHSAQTGKPYIQLHHIDPDRRTASLIITTRLRNNTHTNIHWCSVFLNSSDLSCHKVMEKVGRPKPMQPAPEVVTEDISLKDDKDHADHKRPISHKAYLCVLLY